MEKIDEIFYAVNDSIYGIFPAKVTVELEGQKKTKSFKNYVIVLIDNFKPYEKGIVLVKYKKEFRAFDLTLLYEKEHKWKFIESFKKKRDAVKYLEEMEINS